MPRGRPRAQLILSDEERVQLNSIARSRSMSAALTLRARIVLAGAEGRSNSVVAEHLQVTDATVGKWRRRFLDQRIEGLHDEPRPKPPRTIAAETSISPTSVHRYFKLFGLQPHRTEGFKLSTDPLFIEKLRDVVGRYLSPPDNAPVICVDEKSQCQALERTPPMLPMELGYVEGVTHDYVRHGTTTLFAALNVLNGAVLATCKPRHRHREFLSFLREIDQSVPAELDVHCIVDNYSTHKHPRSRLG